MGSELWFREFERRLNAKCGEGKPFAQAYDEATEEVGPVLREARAERIDRARKIAKGE